jgi:hypothetical protein
MANAESALSNLKNRKDEQTMVAPKTKAQLQREITSLRDENNELQNRLDEILNIAAPEEDDEDDGEDDDPEDSEED